MTHHDTFPRWGFGINLPAALALALASGYGCGGQAPTSLFNSADSTVSAGNAGGFLPGAGGSNSVAGSSPVAGGTGSSGAVGAGGTAPAAGGGSAGGAPSAGASSGGAPSGGESSAGGGGDPSGNAGSGGAAAPSACDGKLVTPPALVADFEQGVAGWFGYIGNNPAPVVGTDPGAAMTQHAARFTGGAAKISGMYFQMPCRNVSDFDGISFWGRSEGMATVRFLAVIPKTDPTADIGDCNPALMTCSDHPGKPFDFGTEWTHYHAAWSELKQLGFGAKASFADVINALLWINDGQVQHFDFSIDEVTFYKGAPPAP